MTKHFGRPHSGESLVSGLPLQGNRLSTGMLLRAADRSAPARWWVSLKSERYLILQSRTNYVYALMRADARSKDRISGPLTRGIIWNT